MRIEPFNMDDVATFLDLAAAENWVAERWEFEFLLSEFSRGCFAARGDAGETTGFVTALRHGNSGWIGNLIVAEKFRGRGIGETLFKKALESLQMAQVETIWLTASKSGAPLYEKYGFTGIDTIIRWVGTGRERHDVRIKLTGLDAISASSHDLDTRAWGDRRSRLLEAIARRGTLFQRESGFVVQQPCGDAVQFGPFPALDDGTAESLFEEAFRTVAMGTKIFLDAPAANQSALRLFNRKKMRIAGSNALMYAGKKPDYQPDVLYGLASMGSCG